MSEDIQRAKKPTDQNLQNEDIDILSNLPDPIIWQILSKLETKEAVATTSLSSRYKSLWTNISSLRFTNWRYRKSRTEDEENAEDVRFSRFVNRVFILLKSNTVNKFYLDFDSISNIYNISTWCTSAIDRNLKKLRIDISEHDEDDSNIFMPASLYTCKTLEVLEICSCITLNVPGFVSLPNVRSLELEYVKYSSDESVRRLISGCTSLTYMRIVRDELDGVRTFTVDSPMLKCLHYSFTSFKGLVESDFKLELNAPKLQNLYLCDDASRDFFVGNLCPLLAHAAIRMFCPNEADTDSHYERVVKLLQGVYNVKHLWIAGDTLEALSHVLPAPNIHSRYSRSSILIMDANKFEWSSLKDLLEGSDKPHDIYLSKDSSDCTHVVHWEKPKELPICLLSCLESISVSGCRGRENELNMISYILKVAKVLMKLTISIAISDVEAKSELLEKILKFDRGSGRCEITILERTQWC